MFYIVDGDLIKYEGNEKIVTIPEGVKRIRKGAFSHLSINIKRISLPNSLEIIEDCVFLGMPIESINIPAGVKEIGYKTFHECCDLNKVAFSKGIEIIGEYAFCGNACKTISIPNTVLEIKEYAFCDCRNLEKVVIPNSVQSIGQKAFAINNKLKTVSIPSRFDNDLEQIFVDVEGIKFSFS